MLTLTAERDVVWVGAWAHRGRLASFKFKDTTPAEAVRRARRELRRAMVALTAGVNGPGIQGGRSTSADRLRLAVHTLRVIEDWKPSVPVEFYASERHAYACTKRVFQPNTSRRK